MNNSNSGSTSPNVLPDSGKKTGPVAKLLKGAVLLVAIALAAAAVTASVLYTKYVSSEDGSWCIDLTEHEDVTQEDIDRLSGYFPDAVILHKVDLGGLKVTNTVAELTLTDQQGVPAERLISAAEQLPDIRTLNLTGMSITTEQYVRLTEAYPQAEISWLVPVNGERISPDVTELQLSGMDALRGVLGMRDWLPELKKVDLTGAYLTDSDQTELWLSRNTYGIDVTWKVTVAGQSYDVNTESVQLSGAHITDLTELYRLPVLRELTLDGVGTGDLSPLTAIATLESITLRNMDVDDISVLAQMSWLGSFFVKNTNVTQGELNALQNRLPECIIMMLEQ